MGRIKSFNPRHGFGFIDCREARARWGRDVFIHKAQMGDLEVGHDITFSVEPNKDDMPQARDIMRMDGRPPGPMPPDRQSGPAPGDKGKGRGEERDDAGGGGKPRGRRRGGKGRKRPPPAGGKGATEAAEKEETEPQEEEEAEKKEKEDKEKLDEGSGDEPKAKAGSSLPEGADTSDPL